MSSENTTRRDPINLSISKRCCVVAGGFRWMRFCVEYLLTSRLPNLYLVTPLDTSRFLNHVIIRCNVIDQSAKNKVASGVLDSSDIEDFFPSEHVEGGVFLVTDRW
jgi:hypothetical protein